MFQLKKGVFISFLMVLAGFLASAQNFNYGEALQKALFFYEAQQSGSLPAWNRVEWRADSALKDDVTGGWYDAGDHVKFGLPMSQSAGMLAWAAYEYKIPLENSGQWDAMANNLRFIMDYFVRCHQGNQLVYQIGNGSDDHAWWGVVECIEEIMTRPSYSTDASCVVADTAATLAIGSLVFNDSTYLSHAKQLFTIADTVRSDEGYKAATGFYQSWSGFWDELLWAATWLYIATGDGAYLQKAESYIPKLNKQGYMADDPIEYQWGHCWDDKHYGAMLLLARLTGAPQYIDFIEMHLDWWTVGYQGKRISYTPGGLAWLDQWGANRYAANTAFLCAVYGDWVNDPVKKSRYHNFLITQINYMLGDNPRNSSYLVGFGNNPPKSPHHRNAHGGWAANINIPEYHRHILYGALVGGPDKSDGYNDSISDYVSNEVATDYNAGFTASLVKMYELFGGTPLADFPQPEEKEAEIFVEAATSSSYGTYTEIRARLTNKTGWPPRITDKLSFRYFINLSEVFDSGLTVADVFTKMNSSNGVISPLKHFSGDEYYAEVDFSGIKIFPGGMQVYFKECQFQVGLSRGTPSNWDPSNDYSWQDLSMDFSVSSRLPVYDNGKMVFGLDAAGQGPDSTPTPACQLKGDVNGSNTVDIVDALMTAQYYVGLSPAGFNPLCADTNSDGQITIVDALRIAQYYVGLITSL